MDAADDEPGGDLQLIIDSTGTALAPPRAAERLSALLEQLQADYDDELTKTIDELLGSTFIEHLRDRLAEAELLREDINKKLAQNPTAISGITLRLRRIPVTEERAANDVLDTLEQHFDMLPKPSQDRIRAFLSERITSAQETARASGDPNWRSRLRLRSDRRTPRCFSWARNGGRRRRFSFSARIPNRSWPGPPRRAAGPNSPTTAGMPTTFRTRRTRRRISDPN